MATHPRCSGQVGTSGRGSAHWLSPRCWHAARRVVRCDAEPSKSVRQAKDPKLFSDMDALREHLQNEGRESPGFISGLINWVSGASFGQAGLEQPWWSPARLYRQLTYGLGGRHDRQSEDDSECGASTAEVTALHAELGPLLLISHNEMRRMIKRYPQVLSMPASEVAARLMDVRDALPGCDACLLIEQHPQLFLSGDRSEKRAYLETAVSRLREGLRGADIASVIMWDPEVLFLDLEAGLRELRDLWDVDEQAMAASEPRHLSTAVRALATAAVAQAKTGQGVQ